MITLTTMLFYAATTVTGSVHATIFGITRVGYRGYMEGVGGGVHFRGKLGSFRASLGAGAMAVACSTSGAGIRGLGRNFRGFRCRTRFIGRAGRSSGGWLGGLLVPIITLLGQGGGRLGGGSGRRCGCWNASHTKCTRRKVTHHQYVTFYRHASAIFCDLYTYALCP